MVGRDLSPDRSKAFVRGLTENVDESTVEQAFSKYGNVTDVFIARDFETKMPRGFAFVTFETVKEMEDAVRAMNGKDLCGRPIHVEKCDSQRGGMRGRGERGSYAGRRGGRGYSTGGGYDNREMDRDGRSGGYRPQHSPGGRDGYSMQRGRGGRGRGGYFPQPESRRYSPGPPRGYEYRAVSRSPPPPMMSRERPYFEERGRYGRPEFAEEYAPQPLFNEGSRGDYRPPRREYSPINRRELDIPQPRNFPISRDPYGYMPPSHDRYSPPPPARREYDLPPMARSYEMPSPRREEFRPAPSKSRPPYHGSSRDDRRGFTAHKNGAGEFRPARSPPPPLRGPPRDYRERDEGPPARRTMSRGHSPPPKRMKSIDSRGGHRSPRGIGSSRRY